MSNVPARYVPAWFDELRREELRQKLPEKPQGNRKARRTAKYRKPQR